MVLAYHLIIAAYGFWLPNDPRGSWSKFVRSWELLRFGEATTTDVRRSLAHDDHDGTLRKRAKGALARNPVSFTGEQARAIAMGIASYCKRSACTMYACAILPEHMHMVIARHVYNIEQIANLIKGAATRQLTTETLHPFANEAYANGKLPTPWARKCWKCFLSSEGAIARAVRYVEQNPAKEGLPAQKWKFVTAYE